MKLNLSQIADVAKTFAFREEPHVFPVLKELAGQGECRFTSPVHAELTLLRIGGLIEVTGRVETEVALTCSRCLSEFSTPLASGFELTYSSEKEERAETEDEEVELSQRDLDLVYYRGDTIDFREQVQE